MIAATASQAGVEPTSANMTDTDIEHVKDIVSLLKRSPPQIELFPIGGGNSNDPSRVLNKVLYC